MTTQEVPYGDYTTKGTDMFKKFMQRGHEEAYFNEVRKFLAANSGPIVLKEVIGEQQYYLYLRHGWTLHTVESPSYGQLFKHRHMVINRADLEQEVKDHEHQPIIL